MTGGIVLLVGRIALDFASKTLRKVVMITFEQWEHYTFTASIKSSSLDCFMANSMTLRTNLSDHVSSDLPSDSLAALLRFHTFLHSFSCSSRPKLLGPNAISESWSMYWPTYFFTDT